MPLGRLVHHAFEQVCPSVFNARPSTAAHAADNGCRHHVWGIGGSDQACGQPRQVVCMLSIQLVLSDHTYTIPQPRVLGDKQLGSEGHVGAVPPNSRRAGDWMGLWVERMTTVETMVIDVLAPDARQIWNLTATVYTLHADGQLVVALEDGSERTFLTGEWMDVRPHSDDAVSPGAGCTGDPPAPDRRDEDDANQARSAQLQKLPREMMCSHEARSTRANPGVP